MTYDSTGDTLKHSQRVGTLLADPISELVDRAMCHDRSKTEEPELAYFDEYTPKLKDVVYGSEEYKACLAGLKPALDHHYSVSRHHPEHHPNGIDSMTLVDLLEMIADWKAATERHPTGDLYKSLKINQERFGMCDHVAQILFNTAIWFGWVEDRLFINPHEAPVTTWKEAVVDEAFRKDMEPFA